MGTFGSLERAVKSVPKKVARAPKPASAQRSARLVVRSLGPRPSVNPRVNPRAQGPPAPKPRPGAPGTHLAAHRANKAARQGGVFGQKIGGGQPFKPAQKQAERKVERATYQGPGGRANPLPRAELYPLPPKLGGKVVGSSGTDLAPSGYTNIPQEAARQWQQAKPKRDIFQSFADKAITAPAVKALDISAIPYHAIAREAGKTFVGKDYGKHASFSDVLGGAGVKGPLKSVAGFALDVAADPTTYATFGTGAIAKKAAEKGVEESALRKTLNVGARAHVPFSDVGVHPEAKIPLPHLPQVIQKAVGKTKAALAETVAPDVRPPHLSPAQHAEVRGAARQARAQTGIAQRIAAKRTHAIQKAVPKREDQQAIIDAVEANKIHTLRPELQPVARSVKLQGIQQFQQKKAAGLLEHPFHPQSPADAQAYFPHVKPENLEPGSRSGAGTVNVKPEAGRTIRKPLSTLREEDPSLFSSDLPKVVGFKGSQVGEKQALAKLWDRVASTGRPVVPGKDNPINMGGPGGGELIYEHTPEGLKPVGQRLSRFGPVKPDLKEMQRVVNGDRKGRFVILNQKTVDDLQARLSQEAAGAKTAFGRGLDKIQGSLKFVSTMPLPSFHARNLMGDSLNAYLGDASAHSFAQSYRAIKALHLREAARGSEDIFKNGLKVQRATDALRHTINVNGENVTVGQLLGEAERQGAIRTGFAGSELRSLMGGAPARLGKVRALGEYREDFPRFASYLSARKRGLNPQQAAEHSLQHHFDYGDLTNTERKFLRRAFPFYTFFARNTRLQATKLLTRPGKYATIAKALDETAKASGYSDYDEYVGQLSDQNQRGIPVPVKIGGKVYNNFISPPTTDLNQLTPNAKDLLTKSLAQRITFFKAIPELAFNYSTFFQKAIQDPKAPLVPAPDVVGSLPGPVKSALGAKKFRDKRSGKMVWGWPAKLDYAARQIPELNTLTQVGTSVAGSRGMSNVGQAVSFLSGVRSQPNDATTNAVNKTYQQITSIENKLGALNQRGINKQHPNAEYGRLLTQHKQLQQRVYGLKKQRGDVVLPKSGGPSKAGGGGSMFGQQSSSSKSMFGGSSSSSKSMFK